MKILVVDDDESVRLFLNRLLTKKFRSKVVEAKNGLEGLIALQEHSPDLILLDVQMPVISGVEMLKAVRSDPTYGKTPVIVMSVIQDKDEVLKLIALGIEDYLLKPLQTDWVYKRVLNIFSKTKASGYKEVIVPSSIEASGKSRVLIVDKDIHFRTFFNSLLGGRFEIREAETGPHGMHAATAHTFNIICLAEELPLLSEDLIVQKVRDLSGKLCPNIYLCSTSGTLTPTQALLYDGVIKKTFVPETFRKEFLKVVFGEENFEETIREIIHKHLTAELITATQQTIGVMSMQEVRIHEATNDKSIAKEVLARVDLVGEDHRFILIVGMFGSEQDVASIATKILGMPLGFDNVATDAFGELINTIGGRIRSSVEARGVNMQQQPPSVVKTTAGAEVHQWELSIPFTTEGDEKFIVGIAMAVKE